MAPTQHRTDAHGGSFANRTRLLVDIIRAVGGVIPASMPLLVRISATEWMEWTGRPSWDLAQSKQLAALLADLDAVDLLDVSSGGNHPAQRIPVQHALYQADLAGELRRELRRLGKTQLAIGAVGMISDAEMARSLVQEDGRLAGGQEEEEAGSGDGTVEVDAEHGLRARADLVLVARQFLREPEFVLKVASKLGVKVQGPLQYQRAPYKAKKL